MTSQLETFDPAPDAHVTRLAAAVSADDLSPRERDMVRLIVAGMSNQEIADTLYLSINSVKTYIRSAYRRMGVETRTQAVVWGVRRGFLDELDDPAPLSA
ncbi:helix-turn-helix transcriptional regulator [Nocardioides dongxiaopingii]|uniref:helix-turn-helix domain-containing protein n=1 Tax=Nocardioides TaxID=1839 RepID=UPI0010C76BCC|nr:MULTISPECIES: helix-turn-helix transcriptional regulator [Nocardioides]QDH10994.1 helix-turn-helix transcriptional regulator [Nocardioides sp. S-1144]